MNRPCHGSAADYGLNRVCCKRGVCLRFAAKEVFPYSGITSRENHASYLMFMAVDNVQTCLGNRGNARMDQQVRAVFIAFFSLFI